LHSVFSPVTHSYNILLSAPGIVSINRQIYITNTAEAQTVYKEQEIPPTTAMPLYFPSLRDTIPLKSFSSKKVFTLQTQSHAIILTICHTNTLVIL